ncbi:sphingosine hydroxylase [Martiniozyma asiatica (nom. inval.)]|nr:sphingosine hydroxylase [Martiniozyma asiatica]
MKQNEIISMFNRTILEQIEAASAPLVHLTEAEPLVQGVPDAVLALALPIVAYWGYSLVYHVIDQYELFEQYRIHPTEEQLSLNRVTFHVVLRDVLFQHIIQTITGLSLFHFEPMPMSGFEQFELWDLRHNSIFIPQWIPTWLIYTWYWYGYSLLKITLAFLIIDTWQFWLHRTMHKYPWLYRNFHSRHHKLYVPYAFGALFNNPIEGFFLDTLGTGVASLVLGLSPRECIFLYTFSTLKTVDDHCGYVLPWDIFHWIFPNNSIYHDIHHQRWGIKYNFSQPFFTFWDRLLGDQFGGVESIARGKHVTLPHYRQFLKERKNKKADKSS